jgi:hypothetical protein
MTDLELKDLRREKWRLNGAPVRTIEDARSFVESAGFCLAYPSRPALLMPTFIGAWYGSDQRLPRHRAFLDPEARDATDLMIRLLRDQSAYEANLGDENNALLVSASVFPYFYTLVGERNPKQPPQPGPRSLYSDLACDAYHIIHRKGPITKLKLLEEVGKGVSVPALDKSLAELWSKLRITRVDYDEREGASWDVLQRWSPEAVSEGINCSVGEALSALLSKYLECVIAADQLELESFFGNFVPRSRVRDSVNALMSARELNFVHVGNRSLIQVTQAQPSRQTELRS